MSENGRSIGRLAWHLVITIGEMCHKAGLKFDAPDEDALVPTKADEIKNRYLKVSRAMAAALKDQWKDSELNDEVNMYGQPWKERCTELSCTSSDTSQGTNYCSDASGRIKSQLIVLHI